MIQLSFAVTAARTRKPSRPAQTEQILSAGLLAAKPTFELRQSPGIVLHSLFHGPPHYLWWLPAKWIPIYAEIRRREERLRSEATQVYN
jgi:hypothetical protein